MRVHLDDHAVVRVGIRVYGNILRIQWTQWTLEASVAFLVLRKSSKELILACRLVNAKLPLRPDLSIGKLALSDSLPLTLFLRFSIALLCSLNFSIFILCYPILY